MGQADEAVNLFLRGFTCSQAVLATYGPRVGLARKRALKVAGAFGGGMAGMGEVCGAVTGSLMVIGLKYGQTDEKDGCAKDTTYRCVDEFVKRFRNRNGYILCRELLGCEINTTEGRALAIEKNLFKTICPGCVRDAAEIIEDILFAE